MMSAMPVQLLDFRLPRQQRGGTLLGFLLGLVIGLAIAAGVAVFVTKAPLPFVSKGGTRAVDAALPPGTPIPDPNKPLYGRDPAAVAVTPAAPGAPATAPAEGDRKFSFYDVAPNNNAPTPPPGAAPGAVPPAVVASVDPAKTSASASGANAMSTADANSRFLLQAGAFKEQSDAEAMKARLALLGMTAQVSSADSKGSKVFRVRVGPGRSDDVNRMKQTLAQNGIDAAVIPATQ
jgi:cell division protein FtsN